MLPAGRSLLDAIAAALAAQGHAHAVLDLAGGAFGPFAYVLPALAPDARHAAWYSDRHVPPGGAALERAAITFGTRDGAPWLHCHAIWREAAGRRAGHVLPEETVIAAPITAQAWALSGAGFQFAPDAETNFTLFQPIALSGPTAQGSRAVVLRVRPNEDPVAAIALACREHGIDRAALRGGVGSLVSPRFADAPPVPDIATELLVTGGGVTPEDGATLSVALADMQGRVHAGRVRPGANAACITCELVLEEVAE
ncbi:PPC domain-containing DNA-binding protein [Paracraurococcus ruber]|uniref:PPC domain-containing DNA-binding protein n=1 Tax=Paracraurococcus ruber TaxID=77675 RepID=UPI00196109B0|nr:PPC domain-containing DNA-binding protein [Paracraurococcus ruber]